MTLQEAVAWCNAHIATVEFGEGIVFLTTTNSGMISGYNLPDAVKKATKHIQRLEEERLARSEKECKRHMEECEYLFD